MQVTGLRTVASRTHSSLSAAAGGAGASIPGRNSRDSSVPKLRTERISVSADNEESLGAIVHYTVTFDLEKDTLMDTASVAFATLYSMTSTDLSSGGTWLARFNQKATDADVCTGMCRFTFKNFTSLEGDMTVTQFPLEPTASPTGANGSSGKSKDPVWDNEWVLVGIYAGGAGVVVCLLGLCLCRFRSRRKVQDNVNQQWRIVSVVPQPVEQASVGGGKSTKARMRDAVLL